MQSEKQSILVVDDQADVLRSFQLMLRTVQYTSVHTISDPLKVMPWVEENHPDIVLLDLHMPDMSGQELLACIKEMHPETIVIIATADDQVNQAVQCTKLGAHDYFTKPVDQARLLHVIQKAIENKTLNQELLSIQQHLIDPEAPTHKAFDSILTQNKGMQATFKLMQAIACSPRPVLILGETGVGKELFSKAVHDLSGVEGEFVPVNAAGLDDTAFSDTLFGHKKGAFTGAASSRDGLVKRANKGSLFLDEIGDLEMSSQVKILRLLQEGNYYPLGSDKLESSDARVIAATHQDLEALIDEGVFRRDLYFRLQMHTIRIPPLRNRLDDIPLLTEHFVKKACKELGREPMRIPAGLFDALDGYTFPGNVRELEMMVYNATVQSTDGVLDVDAIRQKLPESQASVQDVPAEAPQVADKPGETDSGKEVFTHMDTLPKMKEANDLLIDEAMRRSNNNQKEAAKILGMTRQALNKRLSRRKEKEE